MTTAFRHRWFWVLIMGATLSLGAEEKTQVWPLPALLKAEMWTARTQNVKPFSFFSAGDALFVRFDCAKDNAAELRLKAPIPMPDDASGFTFRCGNNGAMSGLWIKIIAKDATGREFIFHTYSWYSFQKGLFFPEQIQRRGTEERFTVPGFKRMQAEPNDNATLEGPTPNVLPVRPFALVGIRFTGEQQRKEEGFTEFFFRNFSFTRLDPQTSSLYYQFRDQECYGELDPVPSLTPAHMGKWYGKRFDMCWDVRDAYEGNPFHADGKTFAFDTVGWEEKSDKVPYPLRLAQKIEFPVKEKGTYWVRVRLRWSHDGNDPVPQEVVEREFRLDVMAGKEKVARAPVPPSALITNCFVRIAPERKSLIYGDDEPFVVKALFRKPGEDVPETSYRIVVRAFGGGEEVKALDIKPTWDANNSFSAEIDLSSLPPGAYRVQATIRSGQRVFDETERLVGRKGALPAAAKAAIPASVAAWKDLLARPKPMFHMTPLIPDEVHQDSKQAWDDFYRPFLDRAAEISSDIELLFNWNTVEPLPGVFDWKFVDRFLEHAQSKGLTVQLWPSFRDLPEWIPAFYEKNVEGQVFGSRHAYLFHGGRPNYVNAPEIRDRIQELLRSVAMRYRAHPAVQSYFFCLEHPGDAPYIGWYEGYAQESIQTFRRESRKSWKTIEAVNQRWGTKFASWNDVVPPVKESPSQYWLDWLRFKTDAIEGLLRDCVKAIRSADSKRLIMMYADGLKDFGWFREQGCMSANGGSHDTMAMPDYTAYAMAGLPQRTEDHSPGNWTAYFMTQLDASVFAMMAGGGANAHCKAYVSSKNRFADAADPNVSLGRYKRFIPIWTELRAAETVQPISVFLLHDLAAYLVQTRTTYMGWRPDPWNTVTMAQAQVPCAAADGDLREKGKLLVASSAMGNADEMETGTIDRMVRYVESGGTLLMSANTGRKCIEQPGADWVLLKRFGFAPPAGEIIPGQNTIAAQAGNTIFKPGTKPFTLREIWNVKPPEGAETAAFFSGDTQRAALSWKAFGKGKVAVLWAQIMVPPVFSPNEGNHAFVGDVAQWAGVQPSAEVTDNRFWTNLLKTKDGAKYYGLVHVGVWQNNPSMPVEGSVRWLALADGSYRVTELISAKELGEFTADQLRKDGIPLKLGPRELAIFRMTRK